MTTGTPVYRTGKRRYTIDTCRPQVQAIDEGKIAFHALTHGHYPGEPIPKGVLPGVPSLGYWDAVGDQDWGEEEHRNEGIELVYLETGTTAFKADGRACRLHAGDLTVTRPWQAHRLGDPCLGPGRLYWVIIDVGVRRPHQAWRWPAWVVLVPEDLADLTARLRHHEEPVLGTTEDIRHCFREIGRALDGRASGRFSRITVHLNHLLLSLLEALRVNPLRENPALVTRERTVQLFLEDLRRRPAHLAEYWTLDRMAEECGLGVTTFVKLCRRLTNDSPMDYLNRCRLETAAAVLRAEPERTVTDIAHATGFSSSQYFAACFRRRFGCTPGAWRQRGSGA